MTPPLIRKVRTLAKPGMVNIIDAPPGTSCPVISAMKGADYVVMVTEPTPFGLHDLTLAVEAVKTLNIPHGIVINRAGSGDNRVQEYAEKENIPVLLEIPYDREMAVIYSTGHLIADVKPEWKDRFIGLFNTIQSRLN
jgi:MinD superfamily P-loop ATPase